MGKGVVPEAKHLHLIKKMQCTHYGEFIAVEYEKNLYCIDYRKGNFIHKIVGLTGGNKKKYPKNAARLIMRDFENDFEEKFSMTLAV